MSNAVHNQSRIHEIRRMTFKGKKNNAHFDENIIWTMKPKNITVQEKTDFDKLVFLVRFPKGRAILVNIDIQLTHKISSFNKEFEFFDDADFAYSVALFAKNKGWKHIKLASDLNFSPFLNVLCHNSLIVTPKPFVYGNKSELVYSEETMNSWWIGRVWTAVYNNSVNYNLNPKR
jgi:hypothetical protein